MTQTFRVGVIGCGKHMFEFLFGSLKWTPAAAVVAACDIDRAKLDQLARVYNVPRLYTDIGDMLAKERLDAVVVAAGHQQNFPLLRAALEAGVNVFVEKTPCNDTAEAKALAELQRKSGKALMVGFNRRFMTGYAMAREVSQRPEFGGIRMYHSQFHATPYRSDEFLKVNHIIHHLDLARFLMGELTITHVDKLQIDDRRIGYNISFRSQTGAIGIIQSASMLDEIYPMERLEIVGDRRNIVVDNIKNFIYNRPPLNSKQNYEPFAIDDAGDALVWNPSHGYYPRYSHHGYENGLRYFFDCLQAGKLPQPDIHDSVRTMELIDQLNQKIGENKSPTAFSPS
ncbi:putative dehydrogenase [Rhizobium sp. BK313]|uniref:Gfo/Idh/MocA family protein n=1 Tax=Rhizobium sp. BK313 TaxID=2587081 RepID=UPI0010F0E4B1|nr:Gfo/Idh/MocA family oxidoreductase [Rhizobium sp. BK313]MBB3457975.1 putative dehydrogenase [Rhizobium sp. BK313]